MNSFTKLHHNPLYRTRTPTTREVNYSSPQHNNAPRAGNYSSPHGTLGKLPSLIPLTHLTPSNYAIDCARAWRNCSPLSTAQVGIPLGTVANPHFQLKIPMRPPQATLLNPRPKLPHQATLSATPPKILVSTTIAPHPHTPLYSPHHFVFNNHFERNFR